MQREPGHSAGSLDSAPREGALGRVFGHSLEGRRQHAGDDGQNACAPPELAGSAQKGRVPAQEFQRAHSPFTFQLNLAQRNRVFAGGNDQLVLAAQNFSSIATEADDRRRKDF